MGHRALGIGHWALGKKSLLLSANAPTPRIDRSRAESC